MFPAYSVKARNSSFNKLLETRYSIEHNTRKIQAFIIRLTYVACRRADIS